MIDHADVRVHPAVHIALERHHDLRLVEGVCRLHALNRLAGVEFGVALRHRVNVVQRRIAVENDERLAHAHPEDVRMVPALLLIDGDRFGRRVVHVVAEAVLHVHEDIGERLAVAADLERLLELRSRVFAHANRICAGHLDRSILRRHPVDRHRSLDVPRDGGVNLQSSRRR